MRTLAKVAVGVLSIGVFLLTAVGQPGDAFPAMKFNDVREVAPGVFFRYSAISATDKSVVFGGCNNTWVVFKDYVVVIDANFPKEAGDVLAAIKKTTDKPVRYVLDTHHHGDHAYGNAVWSAAGAKVVGQTQCARLLRISGPKAWADAAKGRKDIAGSELKTVDTSFDEQHVLDDGTQRVEFRHLGHSHTAGDAVAYLPKHKILCTGDACVNGAFNFMGHSNSASWIRCLEKMEQFDVKMVCPGHGPLAGKDLFGRQKRYFQELREQVKKGIDAGQSVGDITASIDMPWYKEWTGKAAKDNKDNVDHVFKELTGKIDHDRLGRLPGSPLTWPAGDQVETVGAAAGRPRGRCSKCKRDFAGASLVNWSGSRSSRRSRPRNNSFRAPARCPALTHILPDEPKFNGGQQCFDGREFELPLSLEEFVYGRLRQSGIVSSRQLP